MAEYDDLLADLPAPNPEEPASLRDDIADELKDHLQCAARREAVSHPDPEEVENRVLARFGNPQKIARKLWLDWMKEILMTQKITLALLALVAIASLGACGLMWSFARDFQAASAELLTQGRDANRELLKQNRQMMEKLAVLAKRDDELPTRSDWHPLKITVLKNNAEKSPVEGCKVRAGGHHMTETHTTIVSRMTDEDGVADFGLVRFGVFDVTITTPWGEEQNRSITIKPGARVEESILCPDGPPERIQAQPVVKWPKKLEGLDIAVLVEIERKDTTEVAGEIWSGGGQRHLLIRPDGRFSVYSHTERRDSNSRRTRESSDEEVADTIDFSDKLGEYDESFSWPGRDVGISNLRIVVLPQDIEFPKKGDKLDCLAPLSVTLRRNLASRFAFFRTASTSSREFLSYKSQGNGIRKWAIEIPESEILAALAMDAAFEFPEGNKWLVIGAAWIFFRSDANSDRELSQEEWGEGAPQFRSAEEPDEFPIPFPEFMERFAHVRKRDSSR